MLDPQMTAPNVAEKELITSPKRSAPDAGEQAESLTNWFPATSRPTRVGVYQRDEDGTVCYSYWSGAHWCWSKKSAASAFAFKLYPSSRQDLPWRGKRSEDESHSGVRPA